MATLVRWSPFRSWSLLDREMQNMVDRFFETTTSGETPVWRPRVDVMREKDDLVVHAEIPGIDPAHDLQIDVENNVLRIKGTRAQTHEVDEESLYVRERFFGTFERDITLPEGLDPDSISASYDGGILTIRMPLPRQLDTKARRIPVATEQKAIEAEATES